MSDMPGGHSPLGADPLQTARDLSDALNAMTRQLGDVKATVRRSRRFIIALAISLVLDVALTIGVTVAAFEANNASGKASATITQLHASNLAACRQTNMNRGQDTAVWNKLLADLAPPKARTRKVRRELSGINKLIRIKDSPHDCTAVYKLRPGAAAQGTR